MAVCVYVCWSMAVNNYTTTQYVLHEPHNMFHGFLVKSEVIRSKTKLLTVNV